MIVRLARFIALMLLAWQAVVVQAHGHGWRGAAPAGVSADASTARGSDTPADCAVCRVAAQAGQFVAPGAAVFVPPAAAPVARPPRPPAPTARSSSSHAWRSRAPPAPLSA